MLRGYILSEKRKSSKCGCRAVSDDLSSEVEVRGDEAPGRRRFRTRAGFGGSEILGYPETPRP